MVSWKALALVVLLVGCASARDLKQFQWNWDGGKVDDNLNTVYKGDVGDLNGVVVSIGPQPSWSFMGFKVKGDAEKKADAEKAAAAAAAAAPATGTATAEPLPAGAPGSGSPAGAAAPAAPAAAAPAAPSGR